jgi:hypothetical protein
MRIATVILTTFFVPGPVFASVVVSEVMYDLPGTDTKREWIEVTNVGTNAINLTEIVFFEANTSHKIKAFEGGTMLSSGAATVIALDAGKFKEDNPIFSGMLVDSSWSSLSNDGEELEIRDSEGVVLDRIAYTKEQGAAGNGMSLERSGNSFQESNPTPGSPPSSLPSPLAYIQPLPTTTTPPEPKTETKASPESGSEATQEIAVEVEQVNVERESVVEESPVTSQIEPVSVVPQKVEVIKTVKSQSATAEQQMNTIENSKSEASLEPEVEENTRVNNSLVAQAGSAETSGDSVWLYVLALVALLGVAGVGVLLTTGGAKGHAGPSKTKESDSYTIVE